MSITNNIVSTKIYDKRDDFNFEIVNFPFLDGDTFVFLAPFHMVYTFHNLLVLQEYVLMLVTTSVRAKQFCVCTTTESRAKI